MAASLLSDAATFALPVAFGRAMLPALSIHGPAAAPASSRLLDAAISVLADMVIGVLSVALGCAMQQHVPALPIDGPTAASGSNRVLDAAVGILIDAVIGDLADTAIGVLHMAFGSALPQHAPAFSIHGPTAATVSNSLLDAAVGVLIDTVIGFLVDTVISVLVDLHIAFGRVMQQHVLAFSIHAGPASNSVLDAAVGVLNNTVIVDLHIALPAAFHLVVLAALLLVLYASCIVAALAATVFYLEPAAAFRRREQQLAVLALVPFSPLAVAVVILATVGGEE